jgi:hypothetical protein
VNVHPGERRERGSEKNCGAAGLGAQELAKRRLDVTRPRRQPRERRRAAAGITVTARSASPPPRSDVGRVGCDQSCAARGSRGRSRLGRLPHPPSYLRHQLFRRGLNAKQVQVWMGHHSPAFTLDTYVHLPDPDGFECDIVEPPAREWDATRADLSARREVLHEETGRSSRVASGGRSGVAMPSQIPLIAGLLSPNRDDEPSGTGVPAGVARSAGDNSPPDLEEGT